MRRCGSSSQSWGSRSKEARTRIVELREGGEGRRRRARTRRSRRRGARAARSTDVAVMHAQVGLPAHRAGDPAAAKSDPDDHPLGGQPDPGKRSRPGAPTTCSMPVQRPSTRAGCGWRQLLVAGCGALAIAFTAAAPASAAPVLAISAQCGTHPVPGLLHDYVYYGFTSGDTRTGFPATRDLAIESNLGKRAIGADSPHLWPPVGQSSQQNVSSLGSR